MGNNSSAQHGRLFRPENFANDPSAFRVFIKKRNKFIPGWLKINDDEIVFTRGGNNFQYWSLAHLRRYGYTCSGVFFFESGRRCATGEGLHTFQSHQAERIFHMVQSKIKIEEYARGSRAGSVASGRVNSLVPTPSSASRIHPVQRFSSEGANNEFPTPNGSLAPPPYNAFQEARRLHQNHSPNCPSVVSSVSAYARTGALRDHHNSHHRPHSVVSNIEHNIVNMQQHQQQLPRQQHNPIQGNASSSTLLQHMLNMQHQQQHHQHHHGYALPPHMNALAGSASGSCLMNQSFHSVLDSGSPWASQQQLEGDIVMEHVLGDDRRRQRGRPPPNSGGEPPIRIAVPPPRMSSTVGTTNLASSNIPANDRGREHEYVNVEMEMGQQQNGGGAGLNVRELHRTDRSRLEFLSTGPGAFQLPYTTPPHHQHQQQRLPAHYHFQQPYLYSPQSTGSAFLPVGMHPQMQHSFHKFYPNNGGCTTPTHSPFHQQPQHHLNTMNLMSQSISGALPPSANGKPFLQQQHGGTGGPGSLQFTSNSLEQLGGPQLSNGITNNNNLSLNYALIETDKQQHHGLAAGNSTSTLITNAASTNTMATNGSGN